MEKVRAIRILCLACSPKFSTLDDALKQVTVFGVVREMTKGRNPAIGLRFSGLFFGRNRISSHHTEHNNAVALQEVLQRHMQKKLFAHKRVA
jgi:hypothetical protein